MKELFQKDHKFVGHLVELVQVAVRIDVAKPGPHGLIDEQQIGKLIPGSVVVAKRMVIFESIWTDLHQRPVHGTASRSTVQPDDRALTVGDVSILIVPEEEMTVMFGIHLDMTEYDESVEIWYNM